MYEACLAMINGAMMPDWLNSSVLVLIPKALLGAPGQPHTATPASFRPIVLSNASQRLLAKAVNCSLEEIAQRVVHPCEDAAG